jgi:hypothetical protein
MKSKHVKSSKSSKSSMSIKSSIQDNISVICVFKNDIINLKLWLDHYIWQGVDHFYLIDNGCESINEILNIISSYNNTNSNLITLDRTSDILLNEDNNINYIRYIYDKYNLRKTTKWLIGADLDEFWYSKKSLKYELKYSHRDVIYTNYLMFGNNDIQLSHPDDIRQSNINRLPLFSKNQKWILKTKKFKSKNIKINYILSNKQNKTIINNVSIFLNCYQTQSKEYYNNSKKYIIDKYLNGKSDKYNNYYTHFNKKTIYEDKRLAKLIKEFNFDNILFNLINNLETKLIKNKDVNEDVNVNENVNYVSESVNENDEEKNVNYASESVNENDEEKNVNYANYVSESVNEIDEDKNVNYVRELSNEITEEKNVNYASESVDEIDEERNVNYASELVNEIDERNASESVNEITEERDVDYINETTKDKNVMDVNYVNEITEEKNVKDISESVNEITEEKNVRNVNESVNEITEEKDKNEIKDVIKENKVEFTEINNCKKSLIKIKLK